MEFLYDVHPKMYCALGSGISHIISVFKLTETDTLYLIHPVPLSHSILFFVLYYFVLFNLIVFYIILYSSASILLYIFYFLFCLLCLLYAPAHQSKFLVCDHLAIKHYSDFDSPPCFLLQGLPRPSQLMRHAKRTSDRSPSLHVPVASGSTLSQTRPTAPGASRSPTSPMMVTPQP